MRSSKPEVPNLTGGPGRVASPCKTPPVGRMSTREDDDRFGGSVATVGAASVGQTGRLKSETEEAMAMSGAQRATAS